MLGFSLKAPPELLVLGGNAHGAGVFGADAHHHTAHADQGRCRETEFLCSQQGGDGHVAAAHQFSVRLEDHPAAQAVFHQASVSLRQAKLPGQARIVDGASGRRAGTPVIAGDQDDLGSCLGDTRSDGADARLRDKLDIDPGIPVGVFEIVDQLGQVFDGVNVVMGRRGDQGHAGGGEAGARDPGVDLLARQMPALAGLGPLSHFDLDLLGAAQVGAGDAETAGGHLLDLAVGPGAEAGGVFSALARIGPGADGVHGPGKGLMGFPGQGSEAHGPRLEMADDLFDRLHFLDRDGRSHRHKLQKAAQGVGVPGVVDQFCVFLKPLKGICAHCLLQGYDGLGTVEVVLAVLAPAQGMKSHGIQGRVSLQAQGVKGMVVAEGHALLDLPDADPADAADCAGEILVHHFSAQANGLENAGGLVGLNGGDAHFGRDLDNASQEGCIVVLDCCVIILVQNSQIDQFSDALMGQVGTDCPGAEAQEGGDLVDIPGLAALQDQGDSRPLFGPHQVLLHAGDRQEGGDGHVVFVHAPVRQDDDVAALCRCPVNSDIELVQRFDQ